MAIDLSRYGGMEVSDAIKLNRKKLYRLYKEERLTVRKRGGRKRALGTRAPMAIPQSRNLRWSLASLQPDALAGVAVWPVKSEDCWIFSPGPHPLRVVF